MKLLQSLSESRFLSSTKSFNRFSAVQVAELVYLHVIALRILASEDISEDYAKDYASKTIRFNDFSKWYQNATDLHLLIHALLSEDVELKLPEASMAFKERLYFDQAELRMWLRDISQGHISEPRTHRLFLNLDAAFQIKDSSMKAIRRLVQDWPKDSTRNKQLSMTRLLQIMRVRARRSDMLLKLEQVATKLRLELHNVNNRETGDIVKETKQSFLQSLDRSTEYREPEVLSEAKIAYHGQGFVVIENPTPQQISTMKDKANHHEGLRAILEEGTLFVWDGYFMTHSDAAEKLGLIGSMDTACMHLWNGYVELDVDHIVSFPEGEEHRPKEIIRELAEAIRKNGSLTRFYGGHIPIQVEWGFMGCDDVEHYLAEDAAAGVTSSACIADGPVPSLFGFVQKRNPSKKKKSKKKK